MRYIARNSIPNQASYFDYEMTDCQPIDIGEVEHFN